MAHEGLKDIRPDSVEPAVFSGQKTVVVDMIVQHQSEGSTVIELHNPVTHAMKIAKMVVEIDGAGYGGAEVEQDVGEEDHIDRVAHHSLSPGDVSTQKGSSHTLREWDILQVPRAEYRRLMFECVKPSQGRSVVKMVGSIGTFWVVILSGWSLGPNILSQVL